MECLCGSLGLLPTNRCRVSVAVVATDNPSEHIRSFYRSWHFWIQMSRGLSGCLEKGLRISPAWWASGGWALTSACCPGPDVCAESPVVGTIWGCSCRIPLRHFLGCRRAWCAEQTWPPGWGEAAAVFKLPSDAGVGACSPLPSWQGCSGASGTALKSHYPSTSLPSGIHAFPFAVF